MVNVMKVSDLVEVVRWAIALCSVLTAFVALVALRGRTPDARARTAPFFWLVLGWATLAGAFALVLSHTRFVPVGIRLLPAGTLAGVTLAIGSLSFAPARDAFDRLTDSDVRAIAAWRTVFGAFLFAGAGLGLLPPIFALLAGTGDLVVGGITTTIPRSLGPGGNRVARLVVHGIGAADFVDVLALAVLVVRPWLVETGSRGPSLLLPWVAVPILFAQNLHGLRSALTETSRRSRRSRCSPAREDASDARQDGLEPARGL
jgi:hypothetical protein